MKRRIQLFVTGLAAALVLGQRAAADSPFVVDAWSTADGLPQRSVIALAQTRDGYLWLGTLNGLVRFDGNAMTTFDVNNTHTPGLPGNEIVFLFEDSHTNLWAGTANAGICQIKNGIVKDFDTGGGGNVSAAFEDPNGAVWFATKNRKFFCWRNGAMDWNPKLDPNFEQFLIWLAFQVITPDGNWQLQRGHVEKFSGGRQEKDFGLWPWGETPVTAACEDSAGSLVVGTRGAGVFWFDAADGFRHLTKQDALSEDYVLSLGFDSEKNLWVGTDGGGLDRVKRKTFSTPDELAGGVALSAAEDASGGLWASFNLRGLTYSLTNSVQHFNVGQESKSGPVLVDTRQQVWAGSSGEGLFRLLAGKFQPAAETAAIGPQIYALFQSRDGNVWAGGRNGLGRFDGQNWKLFSTADGLAPSAVRALADDDRGNLWIGTGGGGLSVLRDGKISSVHAPVADIACLLVDSDGVLWAGSSAHGLARWQNGSWMQFTKADGLINDIGYLIEDGQGNLWIGSYEGLMRVAKKSLADFAADRSRKISARTFLTRECSAGVQPAAIRTRDGRLWFPTTEGFVSVLPADLKANTNPPPVVIESVLVDGVELKTNLLSSDWNGAVELTPANEQLDIRFSSLNFSAPKGVQFGARFRYRLEKRDQTAPETKWTDAGGERVAHFPKLPPGNYVFRVIACNEDSFWNNLGATLAVTVLPPFWQTRAFVVSATLALIGTLAAIIYLVSTAKLKRQLRVAQQKELIEHERARIARDLHDQLGANLTQVTLLGEMAEADKDLPGEVEQHAQQICSTARETTRSLDEIVWAVNPSNDTLASLANYACKYAQDYFALAGVSYRAELPTQIPPTPILPEVRHNVFLAFKEAVNNVVKHAHATEAHVKLQLEPGQFILSVTDNGRGLGDVSEKKLRNGLKNMRRRLADVRGEFDIAPGGNGGTVVKLTVPVKTE